MGELIKRFLICLYSTVFLWCSFPGSAAALICSPAERQDITAKWQNLYREQTWQLLSESSAVKHHGYSRLHGTITVQSHGKAVRSHYSYYRADARLGRKAPLVFFYSGFVGENPLDHLMARRFVKLGISVVINHYLELDSGFYIEDLAGLNLRAIGVGRALTDFFASKAEVDEQRLGVMGYSYGGFRAYYQMAADPRLKAASLIVAGAPMADVLADSQFLPLKLSRKKQMNHAGLATLGEYRAKLTEQAVFSDKELACLRSPADYFMFIADDDDWTPTYTQWQLWELLGRPRYEARPLKHVPMVGWVAMARLEIIADFYFKRWARR